MRITAARGALTTEATFTEAEAILLFAKLGEALGTSRGPRDNGVPIPAANCEQRQEDA